MRGLSAFAGIWGGKEKEALMAGCLSASLFFSCLFSFSFGCYTLITVSFERVDCISLQPA